MATVVLMFNEDIKIKEAQIMLNENIKNLRKAKGISQEELAVRLNVVRQTVSKWERGISVPDSGMLISLAEELDTSVSVLLGENIQKPCPDDELNLKSISEKLETINLQLAKRSAMRIRIFRWLLIVGCVGIVAGFIFLGTMQSAYLNWDFNNPELAVAGTFLHGVEFLFVRIAPFVFVAFVTGIILTYRKR
ncbi:helix-turn-helix transcriptional regulator [[Ruminococcus] lactaris]